VPTSVKTDNLDTSASCTVKHGGCVLELKVAAEPGVSDASVYYTKHIKIVKDKMMEAAKADDTARFDAMHERSLAVQRQQEAEQAVINEEKNLYKENSTWKVFRLQLSKQVKETPVVFDFQDGNGVHGDCLFTKLEVAKTDVFHERKQAQVHQPAPSPS